MQTGNIVSSNVQEVSGNAIKDAIQNRRAQ
jgi:hypothetical protein